MLSSGLLSFSGHRTAWKANFKHDLRAPAICSCIIVTSHRVKQLDTPQKNPSHMLPCFLFQRSFLSYKCCETAHHCHGDGLLLGEHVKEACHTSCTLMMSTRTDQTPNVSARPARRVGLLDALHLSLCPLRHLSCGILKAVGVVRKAHLVQAEYDKELERMRGRSFNSGTVASLSLLGTSALLLVARSY